MSNKVNRQGPQTVWGRAGGEPESSALHDSRLNPNAWTSGGPPLRAAGDEEVKLLNVQCYCRSVIARLWSVNRRKRTGLTNLLFLEAQIIEDKSKLPVQARIVQSLVTPGVSLVADCPAHGRQTIPGALLAKEGMASARRLARGAGQVRLLKLPRSSLT